jgi:hypothetical protein
MVASWQSQGQTGTVLGVQVGKGNGTTAPEQYIAYHSNNTANPTPIEAGETTFFKNLLTGLFCRIADFNPTRTCYSKGMICDQASETTASIITYTGTGLAYNGEPLVQAWDTGTLLLTRDPACSKPGGEFVSFPPGGLAPFGAAAS